MDFAFSPEQEELTRTLRGHTARILDVAPADHGQHFLSASWDGNIKQWDAANDQALAGSPFIFGKRKADEKHRKNIAFGNKRAVE
jgi:WD40 repeat protein